MNPTHDVTLPVRVRGMLLCCGIDTRAKLEREVKRGTIMHIRGFGRESLRIVEAWLKRTAPDARRSCPTCGGSGFVEAP